MGKRLKGLIAVCMLSGGVIVGSASGVSAAPSDNASCVAQFVHGPPGPPGQFQREAKVPRFGQVVSEVAHIPPEVCATFFDD